MSIHIKTISELKGYEFYVPSYQRGYRWTSYEVTKLLEDIKEFEVKGDTKYCIQPLIVQQRENKYEVVDGQQRLTTIYIFMKIASQEIRSAIPPFELEYQTRQDSASFLQALSDDIDFNTESTKNIDYFHISEAYKAMERWLDKQEDRSVAIQELNTKIRKHVFFIWYALPNDADPVSIFTKVNSGKIPLTNAELIKALLLNKNNFSKNIENRQIEISLAWDKIEQGLQNDSLWYFLKDTEHKGTRIDLLFDILAAEIKKEYNSDEFSTDSNYFSFSVFQHHFETKVSQKNDESTVEDIVIEIWKKVEKLYDEFCYWYADLERYHIIGYLIASGVAVEKIFELTRGKRKSELRLNLYKKVQDIAKNLDKTELQKLEYSVHTKQKIRNILLLFNIATIVCESHQEYRFPFDIYKKDKWDIEHIHATADESAETEEHDDKLGNLALLNRTINRDYKNKPFVDKRKIIFEYESQGRFIPLCTKNVFLKAYTEKVKGMARWSDQDKDGYLSAMSQTFQHFFQDVCHD